jgi:UDPglucose 6-dehydrogenase
MKKRRLNFTTNIEEALQYSKVLFISVGTPADEDGSADLKYVLTVARDSRKHLNDHMLVVTENAVPVGTFSKKERAMQEELDKRNIKKFDAAPNPEFLNEGAAIDDF